MSAKGRCCVHPHGGDWRLTFPAVTGEKRQADADVGVETSERLEKARVRAWLCTDTVCRDRHTALTFGSVSLRVRDAEQRLQGMANQGWKITIVQGFV